MKLSSREKKLLILLLVLALVFGTYFLAIEPIEKENKLQKEKNTEVTNEYNKSKEIVMTKQEMDDLIESFENRLAILDDKLPAYVKLESTIKNLFEYFNSNYIYILSASFELIEGKDENSVMADEDGSMPVENLSGPISVKEILEDYKEGNDISILTPQEQVDVDYEKIGELIINISFSTNYDLLTEAINDYKAFNENVVLKNLSISKSVLLDEEELLDDNLVDGTMTLSIPFYYEGEEIEDIFIDYSPLKEEHSPFEYDEIENIIIRDDTITSVKDIKSDLDINIRNQSSDLPAQEISMKGDSKTQIDIDSNDSEKFILNISNSDAKVYVNYKNDNASYPKNKSALLKLEDDKIVIKVNSLSRVDKSDKSSMMLILNNTSGKKVIFYVIGDDEKNPRFNLIVNSGEYEVIRK